MRPVSDSVDVAPEVLSAGHGEGITGRPRRGAVAPFSQPGFGLVWASGWLWNTSQWMSIFLATYFVNQSTGSPMLVQLAGALFWVPLLLTGPLMGAMADRVDRRLFCTATLAATAPVVIAMAFEFPARHPTEVLIYPFMLVVGLAGAVNNIARKTLVYDIVGPSMLGESMALESVSQAGSSMLGPLLGGLAVASYSLRGAFTVLGCLCAGACLLLLRGGVRSGQRSTPASPHGLEADRFRDQFHAGVGLIRTNTVLAGLIGVTVLTNLFYFAVIPLVPVLAKRMGAGAGMTGVMAAAAGMGMLLGSIALTIRLPVRRGRIYVLSPIIAVGFLICVGLASSLWLAVCALFVAGTASAGFGTMQSTLTISAVTPEMSARAMGILGAAIGGQPIGILGVGALAVLTSPRLAIVITGSLGLALLAAWPLHRRAIYLAT